MSSAGVPGRLELHIRHKSYGRASGGRLHVLGEMTFTVRIGEVVALVGPSGCGKTTLLRTIVGLDRAFEGSVTLPALGRLGMVFQEPRLLPWRTVEQNVRLAASRVNEAALTTLFATLGLTEHRHHYPGELSLGLARRVALARAFAIEPDLLVLDEPFVSLDAALAERLRAALIELVSRRPTTTLLVTHSIDEAIGLADRIFLLSPSPARVIAQVSVEHPRRALSRAELAAARDQLKSAAAQG
jgi:NitT/TauT family transport system ATP-binding protein